jgi:hypothetical protein
MIEIKADRNGKFKPEAIAYLKGQYLLIERIKRRGVGSSKVVYESGVKEFDSLLRGMDTETAFASFELQKNGLVVRMNINQRLSCVGIESAEIEAINFTAYSVILRRGISAKRKTVYNGKLEIILLNEMLKFTVRELEFNDMLKYFSNAGFEEKFHYSVVLDAPEK